METVVFDIGQTLAYYPISSLDEVFNVMNRI